MSAASQLRWRFGVALLDAIVRGHLRFPGGHLPPSGHRIDPAFAGVGVAAAHDLSLIHISEPTKPY